MDYNWLSVLILLSTLIYCGHFQGNDILRPVVTLETDMNRQIFSGETVTLRSAQGLSEVTNSPEATVHRRHSHSAVLHTRIHRLDVPLAGLYKCQGMKTGRPHSSYISDNLPISVSDLPRASVSISPQGHLYSGETVTLQCDIPDYTDWRYHWYENNQKRPNLTSKSISNIIKYQQIIVQRPH
ncbi:hypothetical protein UPYG_G00237670 [Umbra pygmaea]|uniref:Ig-like domain-containing protein n=1 Tax=Umbra pygmaea TaxID=75934 RepID=A0ABD0WEN9_UMBPY